MCRGENHLGHVYALIVLDVKPVGKWKKYFREKPKLAWQIKKHKSNEILSIFIYLAFISYYCAKYQTFCHLT